MKERIVTNAWELVTQFPSLKKLNFLPSLFGVSWLFLLLIYQVSMSLILTFNKGDEIFTFFINTSNHSYFWPVLIAVIVIFICYMFLNPIARGGLIHMMHTYRKNDGKKYHRSWQ